MTVRPILFSAPMIRALIEGRKTQTRRIAKFLPRGGVNLNFSGLVADCLTPGRFALCSRGAGGCWNERTDVLKTYAPGDVLWVRETFAEVARFPPTVRYYATDDVHELRKKRPAIFMPRWASRLTLAVTNVRVERLQDISEADARAEGAAFHDGGDIGHSGWRHDFKDVHADARSSFARLWRDINGPGSWDANPWIVAVTFTVHPVNVDAYLAQRQQENAA